MDGWLLAHSTVWNKGWFLLGKVGLGWTDLPLFTYTIFKVLYPVLGLKWGQGPLTQVNYYLGATSLFFCFDMNCQLSLQFSFSFYLCVKKRQKLCYVNEEETSGPDVNLTVSFCCPLSSSFGKKMIKLRNFKLLAGQCARFLSSSAAPQPLEAPLIPEPGE